MTDRLTPEPLVEPADPTAYALATHIADHPISTVLAAFRYLNTSLAIEAHKDQAPIADELARTKRRAEQAEAAIKLLRTELDLADRENDEFERRHNPKCECEHAPAVRETVARIRAALDRAQQPTMNHAADDRPGPNQPAFDAVFAYIRSQPRDFLPATVVDRNAMIWHAVHAALGQAQKPEPTTAATVPVPAETFAELVKVATHVSIGRGYAFHGESPYPDATARRALGALDDAGLLGAPGPGSAGTEGTDNESDCGAEPPADGTWGDCWCTLTPGHAGEHRCQLCTDRHGAPGWTDPPAPDQRQQPTTTEA